ncbi:unnamed protein product [Prorocentrum cordatum]|uniref:Peptidylprolyl isomerase n=1 Tax=Prorocentrum cordatum TaxID=2364126 RepID=A0ABN9R1X9_9DINO|nr:unnamed protein product [Polarella glacialis]
MARRLEASCPSRSETGRRPLRHGCPRASGRAPRWCSRGRRAATSGWWGMVPKGLSRYVGHFDVIYTNNTLYDKSRMRDEVDVEANSNDVMKMLKHDVTIEGTDAGLFGAADAPHQARQDLARPDPSLVPEGPVAYTVRLDTTVGVIDLIIRPDWAPYGARRFLELAQVEGWEKE